MTRHEARSSATAGKLTESVIREMTRLALAHDAINLAQGFPDFPAPEEVKRAAVAAIEADVNQYPITWGQQSIREALAEKYRSIRPAFGYPACPDHAPKATLFELLGNADHHRVSLTESMPSFLP